MGSLERQRLVDDGRLYYVQDTRTYVGNSVMWWCPDGKGYTTHIDLAGKYKADERSWRDTDKLWAVEEIDNVWSHHVDMQKLDYVENAQPKKQGQKS